MPKFFTLFAVCVCSIYVAAAKPTASPNLVISQIYGDGGTSGATYRNDFIEIYNSGTSPVNLSNYSVQYASGTTWTMTALTAVVLQPGEYYLIKQASNGTNGALLPAADVTGTISMHSNMGKVALANTTSVLPNGCNSPLIVDLVGYGNATCSEGATAASGTNVLSIIRKPGNVDSDNNALDFGTEMPNPRTSSYTLSISINNFSVNKSARKNHLHWKLNCTASQLTFELQRSVDAINFKTIHIETASKQRCSTPFSYFDINPLPLNYYRLKIVDIDMNKTYSKIVIMANNATIDNPLQIHPTKVVTAATIIYSSVVGKNMQWVISNTEGKVIKKFSATVMPGDNMFNLNTSSFPTGQYLLRGYSLQGNTETIHFIK